MSSGEVDLCTIRRLLSNPLVILTVGDRKGRLLTTFAIILSAFAFSRERYEFELKIPHTKKYTSYAHTL